ncbi:MAG: extracellular solute-binding protein [Candidatus Aerophobetes bacterium]|nr:extracellular solute-binding protein [Candidatus Aerophobetes bacterium]
MSEGEDIKKYFNKIPIIDKNSPVPLYYQLKGILKEVIKEEKFKPGDRFPTEERMCKTFGISRTPVRQALSELVNERLLYRRRGNGTFVNDFSYLNIKRLKVIVPEQRWLSPLKKAGKIWNKNNPGRRVRLDISVVGYSQLRFKIITAVARGEAPDFSLIDSVWISELADTEFLKSLNEINTKWVENNFKKDFFPVFIKQNSYKGQVYGIQPESDMALVWYRKDWFKAESLNPPRTWDELTEVAKYFKQEKVRKKYNLACYPLAFPAGLKAGETTSYCLLSFLWSAGHNVFPEGKVVLGEEVFRVLRFFKNLVQKYKLASSHIVSYEWDQAPKLLAKGRVAISIGGSYEKILIQKAAGWNDEEFREKVGFVLIPSGPGGTQATICGGMTWTIFRQSKHPQLALELLKIATDQKLMGEFCRETGQNPPRISAANFLNLEKNWFLYETSKFLRKARTRPAIPEYAKVSEQLQIMTENVVSCRMSIKEAVKKALEIIEVVVSTSKQ